MSARKRVSLTRRGRFWSISYWLDGQRVREALGTESKKIAQRLRDQKEEDLILGRVARALKRIETGEFMEEYLAHAATFKRPKTVSSDRGRLTAFFGAVDRCHVADVRTPDVQRFLDRGIRDRNWTPGTALRYREIIHAAFEYARRMEYLEENPARGVPRPKLPDRDIRYLDHDQVDEVLDIVSSDLLAPVIATYVFAGLRRTEAAWLTRRDFDAVPNRPTLSIAAKEINGEAWMPKTRRNRIVPVHRPRLFPVLEKHTSKLNGEHWLFPSPEGCRWDPDNLSKRFRRIMKRAGKPWNFLDLRHTYGSLLAQRGVSDYEIATLMGNSPEIVRKHYARLRPETMHERVEF
ncbi:MAG: tyrosine-type recombinase/integrase [Planctomycetota bacterium]|nr:tyrosine-type recombinase/integrase [Planctomycetota bacterium]